LGLTRLGVLGWPVAHSRSPAMHNAALAALGLRDWRYQQLPVPAELFAETASALRAAGFAGANVTIPHKHAALALADEASPGARAIGAANTLSFAADGTIHADNTDAPGLLAALGEPLARSALVLGAGGAARASVHALVQAGVSVSVWNRTPARAAALAAELGAVAVAAPSGADLLVNCTAAGLAPGTSVFKEVPLRADDLIEYRCVIDMVYRDGGTDLLAQAARRGRRTVDGLEVLVEQGALSLERWTGRSPSRTLMRRAAGGELAGPPDGA
jgi:shikimate dehydrogenase